MSGPIHTENDFFELLFALAEGRLSPAEAVRLEEMLAAEPAKSEQFAHFMLMVARLHWTRSQRPEAAAAPGAPIAAPGHPFSFILHPLAAAAGSAVFCYALAALVLAAGALGALAWQSRTERSRALGSAQAIAQSDPLQRRRVARVTKALNCRCADPSAAPESATGKVELLDGMLEITYNSGATVTTLGGPVTYRVDSADTVSLSRGLLIVMTPPLSGRVATCLGPFGPCIVAAPPVSSPAAVGRQKSGSQGAVSLPAAARPLFHIRTPSLIVTGRGGAAFCVMVDNATTTVARVYAGKVEFQTPGGEGRHPSVPLAEGGWVFTDRKPDGGRLVVFCTEKGVPSALARRLPKIELPAYSQDSTHHADRGKSAPGS